MRVRLVAVRRLGQELWLVVVVLFLAVAVLLWHVSPKGPTLTMRALGDTLVELQHRNAGLKERLRREKDLLFLLETDGYGVRKLAHERYWLVGDGELIVVVDE